MGAIQGSSQINNMPQGHLIRVKVTGSGATATTNDQSLSIATSTATAGQYTMTFAPFTVAPVVTANIAATAAAATDARVALVHTVATNSVLLWVVDETGVAADADVNVLIMGDRTL
jgi:hypothetical protein